MFVSWPYVVFQWKLFQDIPSTGMEKVDSDTFLGSWVLMASQPQQEKIEHARQQMFM
jgi:hypothetical protein